MSLKHLSNEDQYFGREELEKRRRMAEEQHAKLEAEHREAEKKLHYMKCPKCGMDLHEIPFGGVQVDKCFSCEGIWLDQGELETIQTREPGFFHQLVSAFRP